MSVTHQVVPSLLQIDIVVLEFLKDILIDHYLVLAHYDPLVNLRLFFDQLVPLTLFDLGDLVPGLRVHIEYLLHKVFSLRCDEFGDIELPR